ncbi:3-oxoacyl-ACP reductase family protein [Chakrabartyella piscis]|uniref:SDR family NAD(P)-dependent oxidoreductase n=1 Tax=Chakrabartyella piscis TaxID=2918914 RepID=UPI002958A12F|nr:3-oxoacyl-ACP reductase family protein [Chakrabartyella piscis]
MLRLDNRCAIVTGGAQGIGAAIAETFAKQGAKVAILDLNVEKAKETAAAIKEKYGVDTYGIAMNVANVESIETAMNAANEAMGGIDILVNNAGILNSTPIADMKEDEWDRVIDINLKGTFFCIQKAESYLKASKYGRIINMASMAGRMGAHASGMAYVGSKAGIIGLTKGVARRFAADQVTCNCICPGIIATDMIKQWSPEEMQAQEDRIPIKRLGTAFDVAYGCIYLASDEGGYMTGQGLDINGGIYIG